MFKKKLFKILSLSLSLSIASMGFAFANEIKTMDEPVSIQITAEDEALYAKQAEIDKMLFENYAKELVEKGISITHTGAVEDYIEVGITPYTPENAEIVLNLLGDEEVKVVEGLISVTLQYNPELNEENPDPRVIMAPAELADDSQIVSVTDQEAADADEVVNTTVDPKAEDLADDSKIVSTPVEEEKGISPFIIVAGAVAAIGIGALIFKKKTA